MLSEQDAVVITVIVLSINMSSYMSFLDYLYVLELEILNKLV